MCFCPGENWEFSPQNCILENQLYEPSITGSQMNGCPNNGTLQNSKFTSHRKLGEIANSHIILLEGDDLALTKICK